MVACSWPLMHTTSWNANSVTSCVAVGSTRSDTGLEQQAIRPCFQFVGATSISGSHIAQPSRTAISGNRLGQPSRAANSGSHFGQPSRATTSGSHLGQPSGGKLSGSHLGQPSWAAISGSHLGQPSRAAISCSHLGQPSLADISGSHLGKRSRAAISGSHLGQPSWVPVIKKTWRGEAIPKRVRTAGHWKTIATTNKHLKIIHILLGLRLASNAACP